MGYDGKSLDEYVDVAERLQDFMDATEGKGSLQRVGDPQVLTVTGTDPKTHKEVTKTFIVYTAAAYRHDGDPKPGMGTAWEPFPGATPYTRDSELMNAETAAWGRAILACGLVANRKLASRQEVRNRIADQEAAEARADDATIENIVTKAAKRKPKAKAKAAPAEPATPIYKPAPEAVTAFLELAASKGLRTAQKDGEDPDKLLRLQLAMFGIPNEGDLADCIAAVSDRNLLMDLWESVETCDAA